MLVALDWTRNKDPRIPLGHASLLASLQRAGAAVVSLTFALNAPGSRLEDIFAGIASALTDTGATDLGFGAYVWNESYLQRLLPALRKAGYRGRIILGGPQISYQRRGLEAIYPDADVFVRGYGEQALVELLACDAPRAIAGVHWAGQLDLGEQASVALETLASPFLEGVVDVAQHRHYLRWETQRGCPYRCSFCQHREADARPVRRRFDLDRIDLELQMFAQHDVRELAVLDPVFNLGEHTYDVLELLRRHRFAGRLSLQCHSDAMRDPERFIQACAGLDVHLEFGLQTIHEAEMQAVERRQSVARFDDLIDRLHRARIDFEVSLIYGLPEQTIESFRETVRWCLARKIPVIRAFPLVLLRGTRLEVERERWALRDDGETIPAVIASDTFGFADWQAMAAIAGALARTEGRHPTDLALLERIARRTPNPESIHAPASA